MSCFKSEKALLLSCDRAFIIWFYKFWVGLYTCESLLRGKKWEIQIKVMVIEIYFQITKIMKIIAQKKSDNFKGCYKYPFQHRLIKIVYMKLKEIVKEAILPNDVLKDNDKLNNGVRTPHAIFHLLDYII